MLSRKLLCRLLVLQLLSSVITSEVNITVSNGETAFLPCPFQFPISNTSMKIGAKWIKDKALHLCTFSIENNTIHDHSCKPRFKVNIEGLAITGVENSDAGVYNCVMTRVIPPPAVDTFTILRLNVPSLTLQWINTTIVNCVELFCSVQSLKSQQVNFSWTRAGLYLHHTSSNISSTLTLCKPNWTDGDTIKCHANYSNKVIVTSISLPCNFGGCKKGEKTTKFKKQWIIIAVISTCAGLLFLCVLGFAIFKCKKRAAANGSIVYRNKIYENFTFSTTTINPVLNPQNAQLGATSNKRTSPSVSLVCVKGPNGAPTMLCASESFYPADLQQAWLKDGEYISYLNTSFTPTYKANLNTPQIIWNYRNNTNGSYNLTSYLHLPSNTAEQVMYHCWVNHSALSKPITVSISTTECTQQEVKFTGFVVRFIVVGTFFGLLIAISIFMEVYYQHFRSNLVYQQHELKQMHLLQERAL
ncbi:hypothetical protein HF521_002380 [Silurus meridionalis]|uniref:Ig-like domain-containing protein n=1 Tax=Silurus meridionalis TaxID=175797 RepID=A0A8T0B5G1_SILME|nr:hypothetical protein HF521_002380 [Silurus meridionalis]